MQLTGFFSFTPLQTVYIEAICTFLGKCTKKIKTLQYLDILAAYFSAVFSSILAVKSDLQVEVNSLTNRTNEETAPAAAESNKELVPATKGNLCIYVN